MHYITIFNHGKFEFFALCIALSSRRSLESLYIFGTEGSIKYSAHIRSGSFEWVMSAVSMGNCGKPCTVATVESSL